MQSAGEAVAAFPLLARTGGTGLMVLPCEPFQYQYLKPTLTLILRKQTLGSIGSVSL